jgi:chromosome segregation ATPase
LVSQRKEVKEQKDESEKYFSKLNEIRDLKSKVALWRIWKIKGEIEMRHSNAIQFRSDLEGLSKLELDLEKEFAENKSEQFKISKKMNQAEKQLSQKSHELELIESALMEVNAKLTNFRRRKLEFEKSKEGATKDNDKQKSTVALLRAEILTLNNEENALQTKLEEIKNSLGGDELTINQYAKLKEDSVQNYCIVTEHIFMFLLIYIFSRLLSLLWRKLKRRFYFKISNRFSYEHHKF